MVMKNITQEQIEQKLTEHRLGVLTGFTQGAVASFEGCDLRDIDFSKSDLQEVDFQNANLEKVNFQSANLNGANFNGANLKNSNLRFSDLRFSSFIDADVRGAKVFGIKIKRIDLKHAFGFSLLCGYLSQKLLVVSALLVLFLVLITSID